MSSEPASSAAGQITLPRAIVKVLVEDWPVCKVCTGASPSWDGHDTNPACIGYARKVAREALDGNA